jgi:serine/threonine protein phosphatase PrpC
MIKCNACGSENPDTNKFCQNCGVEIMPPELSSEVTTELTPEVTAIAPEISEVSKIPTSLSPDSEIDNSESSISLDISSALLTDCLTGRLVAENNPQNPQNSEIEDAATIPSNIAISSGSDILLQPLNPPANLDISTAPTEDITAPELVNPTLIDLSYAGLSDVGRERQHNEDGFRCFSQTMSTTSHTMPEFKTHRGLFILCDGMGGHAGGDVASGLALNAIAESFKPFWTSGLPGREKIKEIITLANQVIFDRNETELRHDLGRMGTTLVLLIIYGTEVAIAHVGDSRIYKITADGLCQLTRDHEVAMKLIDEGIDPAIALKRPDAHQLTQALGPNAGFTIEPAIEFLTLNTSTVFLLCSDGLSDNQIVEAHWQTLSPLLAPNPEIKQELPLKAKAMVQLGNDLNGYDNISAVLVRCLIEV